MLSQIRQTISEQPAIENYTSPDVIMLTIPRGCAFDEKTQSVIEMQPLVPMSEPSSDTEITTMTIDVAVENATLGELPIEAASVSGRDDAEIVRFRRRSDFYD